MYWRGEGVQKDHVTAYAWYYIAAANIGSLAKTKYQELMNKSKDRVAKEMTPDQIAEAEELVKEMVKKNPKLLK
jgi:TPR repeat protein